MKEQKDAIRAVIEPMPIVSASKDKNPFKKGEEAASDTKDNANKGMALIDVWKKLPDKPTFEFNPKHPLRKLTGKKGEKDKEKVGGRGKRKSDKDTSDLPTESKTKVDKLIHC